MHLRPPRVLFVGAFPPHGRDVFGGQVTACRSLLQSTLPRRLDLELIDTTQISNPTPPFAVRLRRALCRLARYVRSFERRKPDAVLLFVAVGMSLVEKGLMAWYARLRGVPALMSPRAAPSMYGDGGSALQRGFTRFAFGGVTTVICQSAAWQRFAVVRLRFAEAQTHVIPNWTASPELLAIGRARRFHGHAPLRLLFIGWVDREKGVGELVQACRELRTRVDFRLDIAGNGNSLQPARDYVKLHGLSDRVRFHGWVREPELHRLLAESDVFVLPSWAEGLPNAMIEAMAAALAVVVTAVGGIPSVVTHGETGLLVAPRDPAALAAAIARLADDPDLRARLAAAGCRLAAQRFSVEPAVDRLEAAIGAAIAQVPARAGEAVG